ncbi:methyltransferase-like protein 25B [Amphiura filiformis]|uniref:methyltransferase-like protein 25B n=1 Tax=Amphiura filiformis TaxID=82378 RepID=UPI003B227978
MSRYMDTTRIPKQQLQEYARQLLVFINEYEWLTHAYVVEFFKKNHWSNLPVKWQQCLLGLTPPEIAESVMDDVTTKTRCVWPLSLLAYKATAKALSIPRYPLPEEEQEQFGDSDMGDLTYCYRLHVKPKKRHEIDNLARVINSTCSETGTRRVVDVGSGQGHLSRLLSFGYGLSVTSIEAVGCHITGAAKFDRKVQEFIEKKKRRIGEPSDTLGSHTVPPEHVVCTVNPQITVEEFLSVINTSCKQNEMDNTTSNPGGECKDVKMDAASSNKLTDEEQSSCSKSTVSNLQRDKMSCDGASSKLKLEDSSFLLAGLHTCADLGPTMLRVFAQCQSAHALASVPCCYMKMTCAVENSKAKCKANLEPGDSLQTGGLFADDVNIGKFESYPPRKLFATNEPSAGDANTDREFDAEKVDSPSDSDGVCSKPGFPMSQWVNGQKGCDVDFEPLELGCHSFDVYHNRLKENDPNLIIQGYRALLEILIQKQCPSLIQKHAGLRLIKRALGKIKKGHEIPFEDYAAAALKKLNLEDDHEASCELCDSLLPQWCNLITFNCVRQLLGPVVEALVLVDRMLFLLEQGIDSRLVPIFDPRVSPRNFVLLATKR